MDSVCNCAESADDTVRTSAPSTYPASDALRALSFRLEFDQVQMHMISTLLAAVTSQVCEALKACLMCLTSCVSYVTWPECFVRTRECF